MLEKEINKFTKLEQLKLEERGEGFFIKLPDKNEFSATLNFGPDHLDLYFEISKPDFEKPFLFWTDYYGSPEIELIENKISDIKRIILLWKSAEQIRMELKKNFFSTRTKAYWLHKGQWMGIEEKIYSST